jgi:LmbE family N-acetylglucosaminyl deacetylase
VVTVNLTQPARALAIAAHPDDVEFGCGGTLAKWAAQGCEILHVVCTDGARGSWDPGQDPAELVALRQEEQRTASRALGGRGEVVFLGWPDGELESGLRQRFQIADAIRRFRPDVVLGHDPWRRYRLHPDHRNAGFLCTDGVVAARDPLFFPELRAAHHRPATILLWEADEPNHVEDVAGSVDAKLAALLAHRSQLRSTMHIEGDPDSPEAAGARAAFAERLHGRLRDAGALASLRLGEAFHRIDDQ